MAPLEKKRLVGNSADGIGKLLDFYHETNKEALSVLCSVVMHLGSVRALKN